MPMDDPGEGSTFRKLFEVKRTLDAHFRAASTTPRRPGCMSCVDFFSCAQLDWAITEFVGVFTRMESKR
ncbi:hypothetical protein ACH495_15340 [Micromonospora sp. NPDC018662]|uniref:hypothetical protein n=1 Tax=Micromonospora sp. NPDC018662 TaxID=3364238 RepID=UPI0037AB446F